MNLAGSITALITPFKNGKVDYKALQANIEYQITNGTSGIVPCGTTGESPTLDNDEHKKVISESVRFAKGRVPVIAGTGSNCTKEAVNLTKHAKKCGANASLSVVPYYNKPTQKGLYEHFKQIAQDSRFPIVLYNIPGRSAAGLALDTIVKLSHIPGITAIKEATGSVEMASEIARKTNLTILSGDDALTLPLLSVGAVGVISVFSNIFPSVLPSMILAFNRGDTHEARRIHESIFTLCKTLFIETNPIPVKAAMKLLGKDTGEVRLPMSVMEKDHLTTLKKELVSYIRSANLRGVSVK